MKNYFIILIIFVIIALSSSCREVRVVSLMHSGVAAPPSDSISISYGFWADGGCVSFAITNDRTRPIYIDLKKCVLFINQSSRNYWENKTTITSVNTPYMDVYGIYSPPVQITNTIASNPERIDFIAPKSVYTITFIGLPLFDGKIYNQKDLDTIIRNSNDVIVHKASITKAIFEASNSPLRIRNYLTLSEKENFETEFVIENSWWAYQILSMKKADFVPNYDFNKNNSPFRHPFSYYYLYVPTQ
ncbi:MAG: hypothetical protein ACO1PI_04765 [Bacteroidota bacterium]